MNEYTVASRTSDVAVEWLLRALSGKVVEEKICDRRDDNRTVRKGPVQGLTQKCLPEPAEAIITLPLKLLGYLVS